MGWTCLPMMGSNQNRMPPIQMIYPKRSWDRFLPLILLHAHPNQVFQTLGAATPQTIEQNSFDFLLAFSFRHCTRYSRSIEYSRKISVLHLQICSSLFLICRRHGQFMSPPSYFFLYSRCPGTDHYSNLSWDFFYVHMYDTAMTHLVCSLDQGAAVVRSENVCLAGMHTSSDRLPPLPEQNLPLPSLSHPPNFPAAFTPARP